MLQFEWTAPSGTTELLEVDATERQRFELSNEVTEHAVEQGAAITDHVRENNEKISLDCIVSNTPILIPGTGMDGVSGSTRAQRLADGTHVNVLVFDREVDRRRLVDEAIRGLTGKLLTIRTPFRVIENCVMERYQVERDVTYGDVLRFTMDLVKIRIATTQTVQVTRPRRRVAQRQQNRGAQPAATTVPRQSLALRLASSLRGLF